MQVQAKPTLNTTQMSYRGRYILPLVWTLALDNSCMIPNELFERINE